MSQPPYPPQGPQQPYQPGNVPPAGNPMQGSQGGSQPQVPQPPQAPNPYGAQGPTFMPPTGPSHLSGGGALQPSGFVPGQQQRPPNQPFGQYGQQQPYGSTQQYGQPPAGPTAPPKRMHPGVIVGIAAVVVVALVVGVAFAGGFLRPTATTTGTASATAATTADVMISKPPVPAPATTTDRKFDSPDRPDSAIPAVKPTGFVDAPAGSGLSRYTSQSVTWSNCTVSRTAAVCANIKVPLDYADPDGQAITVKMAKVAATAEPKLGTIFVNPGGPGSAGTDLAGSFDRKGLEQYDIIGWDPRGTGGSTPVQCEGGAEVDALRMLDTTPETDAEKQALLDGWKQFGASCLAKSGALLEHITTVDTVQDLDLMRALVGSDKLDYLGYSYGTYIGAVYAQNFPANVGKLVLDSAVNITLDESITQATGFDLALGLYAEDCASSGCSLGSTKDAVLATITGLLESLDKNPIPGDASRKLTQAGALDGIAIFLYQDAIYYDYLTEALEEAIGGNGAQLLNYGDQMWSRNSDGTYDASYYAFPAISCADSQDDGIDRAFADWQKSAQESPIFGKYFGPNVNCVQWPVQGSAPLDITGAGAAPIVVIGATGDSATPYQYAAWMADQLESGVLVTYDGAGHATYGGRSACIDSLVVQYFASGIVPPDGAYCPA